MGLDDHVRKKSGTQNPNADDLRESAGAEDTSRLNVEIPQSLHDALRRAKIEEQDVDTLKDLVTQTLRERVSKYL